MAGLAESKNMEALAIGEHAGYHFIYPDCRPEFITAMEKAIISSSPGINGILAPFINKGKEEIVEIGHRIKVPFELTRTCYKDQPIACGKCGSCDERLQAFKACNIEDPIRYQ
jgi:7-cyano-7-deazaguanine synthase